MSSPPSGRLPTHSAEDSTSSHDLSNSLSSSWLLIDDPSTTYTERSQVVVADPTTTDRANDGNIVLKGPSRASAPRSEHVVDTTMARNDGTFEATSSRSSRRQQAAAAQYGSASAAAQDDWAEGPPGRLRHMADGLGRDASESVVPTVDSFGSTRKDGGGGGGTGGGSAGGSGGGGGGGGGASASGAGSSSSAARTAGSGLTEDNVRRTSGFYEDLGRERDRAERAGETREPSTRGEAVARVVERADKADKASRHGK